MHELQAIRAVSVRPGTGTVRTAVRALRRKDDLDFHEARQKLLKMWLFAHIGMTYTLVVLALLHGLLAIAFRGGAA